MEKGSLVVHSRFGQGTVEADLGSVAVVSFVRGLAKVPVSELTVLPSIVDLVAQGEWESALRVLTRAQAESALSTNAQWGVFSRSRIALLPHQLWVCRRVMERWPARWLIADDVGLGKTVEAGLIIAAARRRGLAGRVLVLCPASLTGQWQERLRTMFDLRFNLYTREGDTKWSDFWNTNEAIVASVQTMRMENDAQKRLLQADAWDLVIVDEAHHLNADEQRGSTLGYRLLDRMNAQNRIGSLLFFTGTPHRGKAFGFLSLLHLLDPGTFDARKSPGAQYSALPDYLIRNNKHSVTDLHGKRLFQPPMVSAETYAYSEQETAFYDMLSRFILSGETHARTLGDRDARAVILVLITMQKLASSSVAAIRHALRRRLAGKLNSGDGSPSGKKLVVGSLLPDLQHALDFDDEDLSRQYEEAVVETETRLELTADEEARLRELLEVAERIPSETKLEKLLELLKTDLRDRTVLFFTEYKATQSMLMGELIREFGPDSVTFINGDERAEEVRFPDGSLRVLGTRREEAAERFNSGKARFLVSTEAGGEGIDLQEQCHTLVHVDLPWNPMRMHQRVGRLNRFGQTHQVEVISLRNPDTVEDRIWSKLNDRITEIMTAFSAAMDEPEDLFQLVLGSAGSGFFDHLYTRAKSVPREALETWFDAETASFGGRESLEVVKELIGRADKFDFQQTAPYLPRVDLPDLHTLFVSVLQLLGRRVKEEPEGLRFATPDEWLRLPGIDREYSELHFERQRQGRKASTKLLGCGHKIMDLVLDHAVGITDSVAVLRALGSPLFLFAIGDGVSTDGGAPRRVVCGLQRSASGGAWKWELLRDWEVLKLLNTLIESGGRPVQTCSPADNRDSILEWIVEAQAVIRGLVGSLGVSFQFPEAALLCVLLPAAKE